MLCIIRPGTFFYLFHVKSCPKCIDFYFHSKLLRTQNNMFSLLKVLLFTFMYQSIQKMNSMKHLNMAHSHVIHYNFSKSNASFKLHNLELRWTYATTKHMSKKWWWSPKIMILVRKLWSRLLQLAMIWLR